MRRTAKGVRFNRELHGAVGIWSLVLFMLVNFTGVYLAFPQQISAAVNTVWPGRDMRAAMFQARVEPMRGADADGRRRGAWRSPARACPTRGSSTPSCRCGPTRRCAIGMIRPGHSEGAPIVTVIVDPLAQERRRRLRSRDHDRPASRSSPGSARCITARGWAAVYKFLVFVSGVIIPVFAVTGFLMWWLKRRNRRAGETGEARDPAACRAGQSAD